MFMKKLFVVIAILLCFQLIAENPCSLMFPREETGKWGDGGTYMPRKSSIKVYNSNLEEIGIVMREDYRAYLKVPSGEKEQITFTNNVEYVGHFDHFFLRTIESEKDGYLQILINKDNIYLIDKEQLLKLNGEYCTYSELLLADNIPAELQKGKRIANLGINLTSVCLNLRKSPSVKSNKIKCFGGNGPQRLVKLTYLDSRGKWMKVKISYCNKKDIDNSDMDEGGCGGCCCKIKPTEFEGWMKAISEDGFPNIWYSVTSY